MAATEQATKEAEAASDEPAPSLAKAPMLTFSLRPGAPDGANVRILPVCSSGGRGKLHVYKWGIALQLPGQICGEPTSKYSLASGMNLTTSPDKCPWKICFEAVKSMEWLSWSLLQVEIGASPSVPSTAREEAAACAEGRGGQTSRCVLEFTSRWGAKDVAAALTTLSATWPALPRTMPEQKDDAHDILIFDDPSGGRPIVFFEYPHILMRRRCRKGLKNLRTHRVLKEDGPKFQSHGMFGSMTNAYARAGFWRNHKGVDDASSTAFYSQHFNQNWTKWAKLQPWTTFNHLPGSQFMACKDVLATTMRAYEKTRRDGGLRHPGSDVSIVPLTFVLPQDLDLLTKAAKSDSTGAKKWITKPYAKSRGEGIELWSSATICSEFLPRIRGDIAARDKEFGVGTALRLATAERRGYYSSPASAAAAIAAEKAEKEAKNATVAATPASSSSVLPPPPEPAPSATTAAVVKYFNRRREYLALKGQVDDLQLVAQQYVGDPYIIDGLKFDCRVYVVATSYDPLCLFLYDEGLGRFATSPYAPTADMTDLYVHLTNSSVNKFNDAYGTNTGTSKEEMARGSKRSLKATYARMAEKGVDVPNAIEAMQDAILTVFIAFEERLRTECRQAGEHHQNGRASYELFGIDVLFRSDASPVVLELNYSPQIDAPMPMDRLIKGHLLSDTLHLVGHRLPPSQKERAALVSAALVASGTAPVKMVAVKDHPSYIPFFKLSAKKLLPAPIIERNMGFANLDARLLSTPNALIPGVLEEAEVAAPADARYPVRGSDAAPPPTSTTSATDAEIDQAWLSKVLPGLRQRQGAHFTSIFPRNQLRVAKFASAFPTAEAQRRYSALARAMLPTLPS